jgi:hypothetical protein
MNKSQDEALRQDEAPQITWLEEWKDAWTWIPKAIGLLGAAGVLLYAIGFFATNSSLALWQLYDPDPFRSSSILAGLLFIVYLACVSFPSLAFSRMMKRQKRLSKKRPWMAASGVALVTGLGLLALYAQLWAEVFPQSFRTNRVLIVVLGIIVFIAGTGISILPRFIVKASSRDVRLSSLLGLVVCSFFLLVGFGLVYLLAPPYVGGGRPVQKDVWFSKDAAQTLQEYGLIDKSNNIAGTLIEVPKLWVLYSRGDVFVFCDKKACSEGIKVSRDWVKAEKWTLSGR